MQELLGVEDSELESWFQTPEKPLRAVGMPNGAPQAALSFNRSQAFRMMSDLSFCRPWLKHNFTIGRAINLSIYYVRPFGPAVFMSAASRPKHSIRATSASHRDKDGPWQLIYLSVWTSFPVELI